MTTTHIHLGQVLTFQDDPFAVTVEDASRYHAHGAIAVCEGRILDVGDAKVLIRAYPDAAHVSHGSHLIMAGFVDAHMHYPQTPIIASWGKRLIDWLNSYTFPQETRFADPAYAAEIAGCALDLSLAHGTTTQASYGTIHPASVDAYFEAAAARGMAVVAGKTCMDRNAPDDLRDTAQSAYDDSAALIAAWHGKGRARYAITPRFSPTSTPEQLEALGALWTQHPECLMQTHISEQTDEVDWVHDLYPDARDYLDTYEQFGLLGARGVYGHAIYLTPREVDRIAEVGAALVHCPTSNTFIGSGLFDLAAMKARQINVGLATDVGGGSSFSMLRTMAAAYEIGQLTGTALHPAQLLWMATEGSARSLHMQDEVGGLTKGRAADFVVLDLAATPVIAQRHAQASDIWEAVFPTIMMGDDRSIDSVWVAGEKWGGPRA